MYSLQTRRRTGLEAYNTFAHFPHQLCLSGMDTSFPMKHLLFIIFSLFAFFADGCVEPIQTCTDGGGDACCLSDAYTNPQLKLLSNLCESGKTITCDTFLFFPSLFPYSTTNGRGASNPRTNDVFCSLSLHLYPFSSIFVTSFLLSPSFPSFLLFCRSRPPPHNPTYPLQATTPKTVTMVLTGAPAAGFLAATI